MEERVSALEREVEALKKQVATDGKADWLSRVAGSMKDYPEFDEVVRLGREWRKSFKAEDDLDDRTTETD